LIQRLNPCLLHLLHWWADSLPLGHLGSLEIWYNLGQFQSFCGNSDTEIEKKEVSLSSGSQIVRWKVRVLLAPYFLLGKKSRGEHLYTTETERETCTQRVHTSHREREGDLYMTYIHITQRKRGRPVHNVYAHHTEKERETCTQHIYTSHTHHTEKERETCTQRVYTSHTEKERETCTQRVHTSHRER